MMKEKRCCTMQSGKEKKALGILGGMGPLATADLFKKIVLLTDASRDTDHIRIYIDNDPAIPDRTAAILNDGEDPLPEMTRALRTLERCGADCIILPCNTAHWFLPRLQERTTLPILSMLTVTADTCAKTRPGQRAGILATRGTLSTGLYDKALAAKGIECVLPDEPGRDTLMHAIYDGVKKGAALEPLRDGLLALLERMTSQGAGYFILACTEMPIVREVLALPGDFIDPTVELARAAIAYCGYPVRASSPGI